MLNNFPGRRDLVVALAGRTASTFGDGVALVALTLRLQSDGARPYDVGLLLAAGTLPLLLLARPVGRLVDSSDSRHLLVGAGVAEAACTAPLVLVHSVSAIVALVAMLGAAAAVAGAAWAALIPRIVGEERVGRAVSAQQSMYALALVGAPAVGGLLTGTFGSGLPVALDAASFVVVTGAAALVRTRRRPAAAGLDDGSSRARGGFEVLRSDGVLGPLIVGLTVVVLVVGMVDVVLVFLIRVTFHSSGLFYGGTGAAWTAGIVAGSLGAGRLADERGRVRATVAGAACASLALCAAVPAVWMLLPLSILGGIGNGYVSACFSSLLVARTADAERGRVSAAANAAVGSAQGVSLLVGGAVAAVFAPRVIYAMAGTLGLAAAGAVALVLALRSARPSGARGPRRPLRPDWHAEGVSSRLE